MLNNLSSLIGGGKNIAVGIAGLLMTIAFIAFVLSIINFLVKRAKGEANGLEQARNMLFGAVFGLFVMVAVWGITNFIAGNLGLTLGGCVAKPSPIPGVVTQDDCSKASSGSNTNTANSPTYSTDPAAYVDNSCAGGAKYDSFGSECPAN